MLMCSLIIFFFVPWTSRFVFEKIKKLKLDCSIISSVFCLSYSNYSFLLFLFFEFIFQFSQFSCSVVSDSLRPHESQHARPLCPSPTPEFFQTHIHRVSDAIQPSHPLLSPSPPAPNPSQRQSLFQ